MTGVGRMMVIMIMMDEYNELSTATLLCFHCCDECSYYAFLEF